MKTTRTRLLSIYKKNNCHEFNLAIEYILQEATLLSDHDEFPIPQTYIDKIKECSNIQKELLSSIGIKEENTLSRNSKATESYWYAERWDGKLQVRQSRSGNDFPKIHTWDDEKLANVEVSILNLMTEIRNWARHYNKVDDFDPTTNNGEKKWGLVIEGASFTSVKIVVDYYFNPYRLLFYAPVSSPERAKQMLEEFKEDLEKIKQYI